jgi:hypothetical protein
VNTARLPADEVEEEVSVMGQRHLDLVHMHPTWAPRVKPEYTEDGRLHRHRLVEPGRQVRFTSWTHNTSSHQHRLPDGAFTRPRMDLNPPSWLLVATPSGGQRFGEPPVVPSRTGPDAPARRRTVRRSVKATQEEMSHAAV